MKLKTILFSIFILLSNHFYGQKIDAISISQDMMTSMKMNQPFDDLETQLAEISFETLNNTLNSDLKKQAFWVNVYIAYSQKAIADNGSCEKDCKKKKMITVGNRVFSLNDILYKILLQSKCQVSGMKKMHAPKWEKTLRVSYPDGRVLLAMDSHEKIVNAITYFEPSKMDSQLNEVGNIFLQSFVYYDIAKNDIYIPKWLKHFKREFGKSTGMIAGLKRAGVIPDDTMGTQIIFSDKIATFK